MSDERGPWIAWNDDLKAAFYTIIPDHEWFEGRGYTVVPVALAEKAAEMREMLERLQSHGSYGNACCADCKVMAGSPCLPDCALARLLEETA